MAIGNPVAFDANADERDTLGFISMTTNRPVLGSTANCTFDPPVSTPISRKHAIEAAVVRTMKMERTMKSQELVLAVVSQLAYLFKAEPRYIKKRVADLIDREFIVRDEENPMTLHYVA